MASRPATGLPLIAVLVTLTSCWYDTASVSPVVMFSQPHDVDVDQTGSHFYVADMANNRIHHIVPQTARERVTAPLTGQTGLCSRRDAGNEAGCFNDGRLADALFNRPAGIAVDTENKGVFVADSANHRVRVINIDKDMVTTLAGTGEAGFKDGVAKQAKFDTPTGLDFDFGRRKVYVADSNNKRVRVIEIDSINPQNTTVNTLCHESSCGFLFQEPVDVACNNGCTKLYVVDTTVYAPVEIDIATQSAESLAQDPAFSNGLSGIAVDVNNNVYVTCSVTNTIWVYSSKSAKKQVQLSEQDIAYGQSDNPTKDLRSPMGLSVNILEGKIQLYVADTMHDQIRQITMPTTSLPDAGPQDLAVDAATGDAAADTAVDATTGDAAADTAGQ